MEYEMIREIKNLCRNNQMRDISFEEVVCDDPLGYVRGLLEGRQILLEAVPGTGGSVVIHADCDGLIEEFVFTPI